MLHLLEKDGDRTLSFLFRNFTISLNLYGISVNPEDIMVMSSSSFVLLSVLCVSGSI